MKWKSKKELCVGEERIKSKFLMLPKKIGEDVRWLEKARYIENLFFNIIAA